MDEADVRGSDPDCNRHGVTSDSHKPRFYKDAKDPLLYRYIPGTPGLQHSSDGTPQFNVIVSHDMAMLQISVEWGIDSDTIESFRAALAEKEDMRSITGIRFAPAPYVVEEVVLLIADMHREMQTVATASPSGFGNNAAVFNLQLNPEQKERAIAALQGEQDLMQVIYSVSLPRTHQATTRIHGDVRNEVMAAKPDEGMEVMRHRVMTALAEERLTLQRDCVAGESEDLQQAADDAALTAAAEALCHMVQQRQNQSLDLETRSDENNREYWTIEIEESVENQTFKQMRLVSDAGDWMPDGDISRHLQVF